MYDFVDNRKVINIAVAIILFIMAFIIPVAIIFPFKSSFITQEALEIGTSPWSLITGGVGIVALGLLFLVFAMAEKKKVKITLSVIFSLFAVLGVTLSAKDYYYITPSYFAASGPLSFETKVVEWDDFESVEEILGKEDGTIFVEAVIFHMKDGSQLKYSGGTIMKMYTKIIYYVQAAGGEHIRSE